MARYRVLFESDKEGALNFEAVDEEDAKKIYEGLLNGDIYLEDLEDMTEDIGRSNISYFELTTLQGKSLSN